MLLCRTDSFEISDSLMQKKATAFLKSGRN